jgi:hypothetical protein
MRGGERSIDRGERIGRQTRRHMKRKGGEFSGIGRRGRRSGWKRRKEVEGGQREERGQSQGPGGAGERAEGDGGEECPGRVAAVERRLKPASKAGEQKVRDQ